MNHPTTQQPQVTKTSERHQQFVWFSVNLRIRQPLKHIPLKDGYKICGRWMLIVILHWLMDGCRQPWPLCTSCRFLFNGEPTYHQRDSKGGSRASREAPEIAKPAVDVAQVALMFVSTGKLNNSRTWPHIPPKMVQSQSKNIWVRFHSSQVTCVFSKNIQFEWPFWRLVLEKKYLFGWPMIFQ